MKIKYTIFVAISGLCLAHCQSPPPEDQKETSIASDTVVAYPPAEGFHLEASDPEALHIADQVMKAMGGYEAWQQTRYIHWNFFGRRTLLWDKFTDSVRIDLLNDSLLLQVHLPDVTGNAYYKGMQVTPSDSLNALLEQGKRIWINDSYWLVMPFKLKDSGVTLTYLGEETIDQAMAADVLQLTFEDVGVTPQNKYRVYVAKEDHLVRQWDFFPNAEMDTPRFSTPWSDYQKYGDILLSGDRGSNKLSEIMVFDQVPPGTFTTNRPLKLE